MKKKNKSKKKAVRPLCKNCLLYDFHQRHCKVVVMYEGQKINPPTEPTDYCIFEATYQSIDGKGQAEIWKPEVKQIKTWVEDPQTGKPSTNGVVKIGYPEELEMKNGLEL